MGDAAHQGCRHRLFCNFFHGLAQKRAGKGDCQQHAGPLTDAGGIGDMYRGVQPQNLRPNYEAYQAPDNGCGEEETLKQFDFHAKKISDGQ